VLPTTRAEIDALFLQWAKARGLAVDTFDHWDETVQRAIVVDTAGDTYEVFAGPDPKDPEYPSSRRVLVGAGLSKRGDRRYHALRQERARFQLAQLVVLAEVEAALEASFKQVELWISEAGHDINSPVAKREDA
jgi:hypothetical protein